MRVLLGAFGDPGHAFPMLALGCELLERGHDVGIETWKRWREDAEAAGMTFAPAPEYQVFPTREQPLKPYEAAVLAAQTTRDVVRSFAPDVVVTDILTTAPALAAELEGVPFATLIPHLHPDLPPGWPPFSIGARLPRTRVGTAFWKQTYRLVQIGLEQGRREYNDCRARLGLPPLPYVHTGLSRSLTLVGTFPQLEYPRRWEPWQHVVGPMLWEPGGPLVEPGPGTGPVVLIATSTSQDPSHRLLNACLDGLAGEPVRVIAISSERPAPANTVLAPWMSYEQTMPHCDLVITHGGSGTLHRALVSGVPVLLCPAGGDMAENAARVDWAGVGVRLAPRFCTPWGIRLAVRRALRNSALRSRARELADWAAAHPGRATAATRLERWAATAVHSSSAAARPSGNAPQPQRPGRGEP